MTKQEEIKQRIKEILIKPLKVPYQQDAAEMMVQGAINQAEEILSYLHSRGVVIKVERELPDITDGCSCEVCQHFRQTSAIPHQVLLSAGYIAVEPLIEAK